MTECNLIWDGWNQAELDQAARDITIFGNGLVRFEGRAIIHVPIGNVSPEQLAQIGGAE